MKLLPLAFMLFTFVLSSNAHGQFSGKVMGAETRLPLQGAVIHYDTTQTISGHNGNFYLPDNYDSVFIVSHLGYNTDTISDSRSEIYLVPDYKNLGQVIIRGPLVHNNLINLPASIAMLHRTDLHQTPGITYMEDLNRIPGVYVHSGTANTNRVTIRGIGSRTPYGSNRIKAYFNDIPLTSGDGSTSIEDIDPAMINTIEILRGSKSAIYGSGLGGIIMISGREYFEKGLHGTANIEAGSFGTLNPKLIIRYKKGELSTSATYSHILSDGWRQNSSYYRHSGHVYTSFKTKRNKTDILFHFIDMKANIPSSLNEETFKNAPDSAAANWLAVKGYEQYNRILSGIRNDFKITEKLRNKTVLFFTYYNGYESRPFNILADNTVQGGLKSSFNYSIEKWDIRVGFEMLAEKYKWQIYETDRGNEEIILNSFSEIRNPVNLYLLGAYTFSNGGIIETGLSYNFLKYNVSDHLPDSLNRSGKYRYSPVLSPFLGINLPLGSRLRFYASAGHGFSYPGVEETLLPEGQVNPNLKPESGMNIELGTRFSTWNGRIFTDLNVYIMFVKDLLITERLAEDTFYGKNAGRTRHAGIEALTSLRINESTSSLLPHTRLDLSFTISDNRFTDFTDNDIDYSGNHIPGIPSTKFYSGISFSYLWGLYANLQYNYTGQQYLDDSNSGKYHSYNLVHCKLGYKLAGNSLAGQIYIGIQNLFDQHYASMILVNAPSFDGAPPRYYYPGMPRSYYIGVSILL